jgi:hypothetical protein
VYGILKVCYRVHKSPPLHRTISQMNPFHTVSARLLGTHLGVGLTSRLPLTSAMRARVPARLTKCKNFVLQWIFSHYAYYLSELINLHFCSLSCLLSLDPNNQSKLPHINWVLAMEIKSQDS